MCTCIIHIRVTHTIILILDILRLKVTGQTFKHDNINSYNNNLGVRVIILI